MKRIALVGATGNVGRKIIEIMEERELLNDIILIPVGSINSQGLKLSINGQERSVMNLEHINFSDFDVALFAAGSKVAEMHAPKAAKVGCPVIDCSSFFRMDPAVPLIVPTVNLENVEQYERKKIISGANCIASPLATVLSPLHKIAPIHRLVVSTYQSVSGAGKAAMDELTQETKAFFTTIPYNRKVFDKPIAFNALPMIDKVHSNGSTGEETKIALEIKKVLDKNISVSVQCVRIPVFVGHASSVFIEFSNELTPDDAKDALRLSPHVTVIDDYENCISPLEAAGEDQVFVSRLRYDNSVENGLVLWVASDNLRRGAALDAVETLQHLLNKYI